MSHFGKPDGLWRAGAPPSVAASGPLPTADRGGTHPSRRAFLQGLGGALALPLLQLPRGARAANSPYPKRFLVFYQPNGTKKELWSPSASATERNFMPGALLAPVLPFLDRLNLFDGVDNTAAIEGYGDPHQRGMASVLTGQIILPGDFVGGDGTRSGWGGGISIDQYLAQQLAPATPITTLELGARVNEAIPRARIIYRGPDQPIPPENDPVAAYTRLFGGQSGDPRALRRLLARRRSVLDSVLAEFKALEGKVSAEDREKLDRHATTLRDLERRLANQSAPMAACVPGSAPTPRDVFAEDQYGVLVRTQIDLLVRALACDVTRIGSLQCSTAVNALRFTFLGLSDFQGHALSHAGDGNAGQQAQWERMLTWYSEQFAYLLASLDAVPEGDGTLLDNTVVLWVNELHRGNTHKLADVPFIVAGGKNLGIQGGRYFRLNETPHNNLLLSLLHAFGLDDTRFGDRRLCTGPIPGFV